MRRGPRRRHRAVSLAPPPGQPVASSHARSRGSAPAAQRPRVFYPCSICTCSPCTALGRGGGARSPYSQRLVRGSQGRNSGTTGPGRAAASGSRGAGGREPPHRLGARLTGLKSRFLANFSLRGSGEERSGGSRRRGGGAGFSIGRMQGPGAQDLNSRQVGPL